MALSLAGSAVAAGYEVVHGWPSLPAGEDLGSVSGVAVDGVGDLFFVNSGVEGGTNMVEELFRSQPPALNFAMLTDTGTVDAVDGSQTVQVMSVGNQPLTVTGLSYPADFSQAPGDANACTTSTSLAAGQVCDVSIQFSPQGTGTLSEGVTLTDNALNAGGAHQSIQLSGTAEMEGVLTSPARGSVLPGPSAQFTWSAGTAVTWYFLSFGSKGPGSNDLYNSGRQTTTSRMVTGLPTNGETIYARLTTNFNGVQLTADSTYTAATQAVMVSPAAGSQLPGPTVTFTWTAGTGATADDVWLGSKGAGSNDIYSSGQSAATSLSLSRVPTNGETIYVRLFTSFNGVQTHADYTYTAAAQAVLTSPVSGAVLTGATVTFTGTAATGGDGTTLVLGSAGAGSSNLYNSGVTAVPSATATSLPTNGETIYARVYTNFNGTQVYADYTFKAAKQATMIYPSAGSVINVVDLTFRWSAGAGESGYSISIGDNGAGSTNLFNSGDKIGTSVTVKQLPMRSGTVYVRLTTHFNGTEAHSDYIYTVRQVGSAKGGTRPVL
jgi:hypothetical protein